MGVACSGKRGVTGVRGDATNREGCGVRIRPVHQQLQSQSSSIPYLSQLLSCPLSVSFPHLQFKIPSLDSIDKSIADTVQVGQQQIALEQQQQQQQQSQQQQAYDFMLSSGLCAPTDEGVNYTQVIKPTCEAAAFHEWNPAPLTYHNPHHFQLFFPPQVLYPEPAAPVPVPSPADWSNPYLQHQLQQHALIQQSHQQQQHDSHDMKFLLDSESRPDVIQRLSHVSHPWSTGSQHAALGVVNGLGIGGSSEGQSLGQSSAVNGELSQQEEALLASQLSDDAEPTSSDDLEGFAKQFKQKRIKLG
ncbi:hypothetical protein WR25_11572 [Diploscapter pachys]|uniref:POU-specific domain-containing protein n=1 Tax=Diploscapter pachys TaxID=2018661 RepID=A0A2A2JQ06_9BILA|nr:hypothetical protein WR25_11572 [Diploscapter pachys]